MQITAREISVKALRLLKVIAANESGSSQDLDVCLKSLNDLLDSLSLEPNAILSTVIETFPVTGALQYTVGPTGDFATDAPIYLPTLVYTLSGVDYTVSPVDEDQFAQIPVKNTPGPALVYWMSREPDYSILNVWPAPTSGTLTLHSLKAMEEFANLDTQYTAAPGYKNMLAFNLAVDVAPMFETEAPKTVLLKAMSYKRQLKRSNVQVPVQDLSFLPAGFQWNATDWRFQ